MILDNKNENQKVYEWLGEYTESGKIDIVTGYFTVGALAYLSKQINDKVKNFRMVLEDIVNIVINKESYKSICTDILELKKLLASIIISSKKKRNS
ncbi:MAG: hypothetical protein J7L46_01170, partial [Bacteroidales bacterium]|nr:hypothetical protein [Bacteroidales bacterium]